MGTKVYTKQCMYSLKQSHGDLKKKNVVYMFSQESENKAEKGSMLWDYKHEGWDIILVCVTRACSVLLWRYVTMMIVAESAKRSQECLNAPQPEKSPVMVSSFHRVTLPFVE